MTRSELNVNYTGDFTVSTSLTKAEIKLENFTVVSGSFDYNGTWEIVQLDDDFLIIANDREGTSGIKELEFTKKNNTSHRYLMMSQFRKGLAFSIIVVR